LNYSSSTTIFVHSRAKKASRFCRRRSWWRKWGRGIRGLPGIPWYVVPQISVLHLIQTGKKEIEHGMHHWRSRMIKLQVRLSDVGDFVSPIDQDVIPWLYFLRLSGVGLVPSFRSFANRVRIHDKSSVTVGQVRDYLS